MTTTTLPSRDTLQRWTVSLASPTGDTDDAVLAQYSDDRWNGFLCPFIDALSVAKILDASAGWFAYDFDGDVLVLTERFYAEEGGDEYVPERIEPDEDGLYPLGAWSWTWAAVEPGCPDCGMPFPRWEELANHLIDSHEWDHDTAAYHAADLFGEHDGDEGVER